MLDAVQLIKKAALDAVDASKAVNVLYGTVESAAPLKINVEQKMTLGVKQLVLCRAVTDYDVDMEVSHATENNAGAVAAHTHPYAGIKTFRVKNALKQGEKVALLRFQGGQKFLVVDRVVG